MSLCQYKDIFGKPGEGAHQYRVFDIAIVDTFMTIIIAILISLLINYVYNFDYVYIPITSCFISIILFIIGIFMHRLFCVRTTIDKLLFN